MKEIIEKYGFEKYEDHIYEAYYNDPSYNSYYGIDLYEIDDKYFVRVETGSGITKRYCENLEVLKETLTELLN